MTDPDVFPLPPIELEVICTSVADARAAAAGGASRIELVDALDRGGLTPPLALVDAVLAAVELPVRVMVRETESHEIDDAGVRDALVSAARQIGARSPGGVVFGAVRGGLVDRPLLDEIALAARCPVTFHRAFESVSNPDAAIDTLAGHDAVDLVLCDGGEGAWDTRAGRIAAWTRRAGGRLRVMPGGGVTDEAIAILARCPEVSDLHLGRLVRTPATADGVVDASKVAAVVERLAGIRKPG